MIITKLQAPGFIFTLATFSLAVQLSACNTGESGGTTQAAGAEVSLSWVAPSEREDNQPIPLSDIAGYKLYYGTAGNRYNNSIVINDGSADSFTVKNLTAGTYFFALTTIDTAGRESRHSPTVKITVQNS